MAKFEYRVVPAPQKSQKVKGVKAPEARFALSVQSVLNEMGAQGWEYLRAELLPSEERSGLTGTSTHWRNVLVFRRPLQDPASEFAPRPVQESAAAFVPAPHVQDAPADTTPRLSTGALRDWPDNPGAEPIQMPGMTRALKARAARQDAQAKAQAGDQADTDKPEDKG